MDSIFYAQNRRELYEKLEDNSLLVLFAGQAPRRTADQYHRFFADRNFAYMTGLGTQPCPGFVLLALKGGGEVEERLYILPPDLMAERWNGRRIKEDEAREMSGICDIRYLADFEKQFFALANSGAYGSLYLDLYKNALSDPPAPAHIFAADFQRQFPGVRVRNALPFLRALRTIKKPAEIEAMKKAMAITRKGILAMMRASRPGMYEYQYKAAFDEALTQNGVLESAFPPIISAGENNFSIHYDAYTGLVRDGDMVLNDVGAIYGNMCTDVSRGWPANGKFTERQKLLYTCAYNTSEYMFGIIRPGMPMADVDKTVRRCCFEQLKGIGLVDRFEDVGRYMWHGGAHHVGFDVHDVVDMSRPVSPGMVFCVDVGIYCQEWGIGFRLEDNCLVTETGCENLSKDIPRSIAEIEGYMASGN